MKKKSRTQKQQARLLGIWVSILALMAVCMGLFIPHPHIQIRNLEASFSCGETELVRKERLDRQTHYLTANRNTLLLTVVEFRPLMGWDKAAYGILDLTKEDDLSVETFRTSPRKVKDPKDDILTNHYFGTAPREAVSVLIHFPWVKESEPFEIPTFCGEDGRTYFWGWKEIPFYESGNSRDYYSEPLLVEALDRDGQVIAACNHPRYYDGAPLT